jgi:hypothetical protein
LSQKSLVWLAHQAQSDEKLCLLPYTTRQVQATEEHYYDRRMNFCNWFFQAVYYSVLDPKLKEYLMTKPRSIWVLIWMLRTGTAAVIVCNSLFKVPLHDRNMGCHYCYENSRTDISFSRPLILSGMSMTFLVLFWGHQRIWKYIWLLHERWGYIAHC